jgi:class 3 adenylate cyclase/tetratricopeptide (TPR) repeat protein
MVGERRVVTMLFCDVKGSTAAAEQLDPEDWTEIMNGAFAQMIPPVYYYEGTVARLMGDALLAFFGAPIAHEDDPRRAILAGLKIVKDMQPYRESILERFGIDFNIRVGINTGLVVVGAVGSDLRMEYSALGDAINLASRMEQTALPGTVQVAHDTYKLVKSLFEFEALGGIDVKGKTDAVLTYRVLRPKTDSAQMRGIEGLHAEMVNRQSEMLTLHEVMKGLRQGIGHIVCVLGEAGLGKTRLISEAHAVFNDLAGPQANWYETPSLSYEANQAYGLFQRLIQRVYGIDPNDPPQGIRQKITPLIGSLEAAGQTRAGQVFEALLGLRSDGLETLDAETFKQELLEAIRTWWRTNLAQQPTVLVFDDMHWIDSASVELLKNLLSLTEQVPLVLLCVMRAERQSPAWQITVTADEEYRHRSSELVLRPFSESESNELLDRLLAKPELPDHLRASILEKSGGNPFFIEEVVRTLIDSGALIAEERSDGEGSRRLWRASATVVDFEIPDNLQSLLSARLDRLEDGTRGTLQLASVIGRSFYHRVLQAVDEASAELNTHLGTLVRLDLIREAARLPELEYAFRNPLTQEAVYNTILLRRRRAFHRRVGEAIEALYADQLEGLSGLLAHHFTVAGERDKAIEYSRIAARQALSLFAFEDAARNLETALDLIKPDEKIPAHLSLVEELADVYRLLRDGPRALPLYQRALELSESLAESDDVVPIRLHRKIVQFVTESRATVEFASFLQTREISARSRLSLERLLERTRGHPPHPEFCRALAALSYDTWLAQLKPDWDRAEHFARAAVEMAEKLDDPVIHSRALGALARVLDGRGQLREHAQIARRRLELTRGAQNADPAECIDALTGIGMALMYVGEYVPAMLHIEEAIRSAESVRAIGPQVAALGLKQHCLFRLDRWDEMLAVEQEWRALEGRYTRARVGVTCFAAALSASVRARRGEQERAKQLADESYDYMVGFTGSPDKWQRNQFF